MNAEELIKEVYQDASEWTEMTKDPALLVAGILANKVIKLTEQIEYLEKRIKHVSRTH